MQLTVVIVNYKTPDMTLESAASVVAALNHLDISWELLIVDNDSQDGSYETIKKEITQRVSANQLAWRNVEVLQSGFNGGFGAGNNFAIKRQLEGNDQPEYFYLLNSDAFPEENAVKNLFDVLESNRTIGIAGSYIHGPDGEPHTTAFRFPTILGEFEGAIKLGIISNLLSSFRVPMGIPENLAKVDWIAGASMMIRSDVFNQIGLFDEEFFLYFEETDLCRRAKNAGWPVIYVRSSSVCHIGSVSTGMKKWRRLPLYWLASRKHYFVKNHGYGYYVLATIVYLVGELLWKIRVLVEKKEPQMPENVMSDLLKYLLFGSKNNY